MQEQPPPEPDRPAEPAYSAPLEPCPTPEQTSAASTTFAAQPSGGDPFHTVQPPPLAPPPPTVLEVEATALSASDVRRPVVDAAPPPPAPTVQSAAASAQATSSASAPPPPPASPPPQPPQPPAQPKAPPTPSRFKRNAWAVVCHLLLVLVIPTVFLGATITFLIWQFKGKSDSHVEDQGREALNFQINVAALTALLTVSCLGAPLIVLVWFVAIVMAIIAARHAFHGEAYRYPWVLRIVSH